MSHPSDFTGSYYALCEETFPCAGGFVVVRTACHGRIDTTTSRDVNHEDVVQGLMLLLPGNSIGCDALEGSEGCLSKVRASRREQVLSWHEREPGAVRAEDRGAVRSHVKLEQWDATGIEHQGAVGW
jgi:hypothetical protein